MHGLCIGCAWFVYAHFGAILDLLGCFAGPLGARGDQQIQKEKTMDYSKTGNARGPKNAPRHTEHNQKGTVKNPYGAKETKADLLARMKAAAQAKDPSK